MKITSWSTPDKKGNMKHNHIENGWVEGEYPLPIKPEYTNQKAWKHLTWLKEFKYLVNDKVMDETF